MWHPQIERWGHRCPCCVVSLVLACMPTSPPPAQQTKYMEAELQRSDATLSTVELASQWHVRCRCYRCGNGVEIAYLCSQSTTRCRIGRVGAWSPGRTNQSWISRSTRRSQSILHLEQCSHGNRCWKWQRCWRWRRLWQQQHTPRAASLCTMYNAENYCQSLSKTKLNETGRAGLFTTASNYSPSRRPWRTNPWRWQVVVTRTHTPKKKTENKTRDTTTANNTTRRTSHDADS